MRSSCVIRGNIRHPMRSVVMAGPCPWTERYCRGRVWRKCQRPLEFCQSRAAWKSSCFRACNCWMSPARCRCWRRPTSLPESRRRTDVHVVALTTGAITASAGLTLMAEALPSARTAVDTLVVAGGVGVHDALPDCGPGELGAAAGWGGATGGISVHGGLPAGGGGAAGWAALHDALAAVRGTRAALSVAASRERSDLCARRRCVDLGRSHRRGSI